MDIVNISRNYDILALGNVPPPWTGIKIVYLPGGLYPFTMAFKAMTLTTFLLKAFERSTVYTKGIPHLYS